MNWLALKEKNENWTRPFFKSVLYSFNSSVNGPQRIGFSKSVDNIIFDISSYIPQSAQYGFLTSIFLIFLLNSISSKKNNLKNVFTLYYPTFLNFKLFLVLTSLVVLILISPILYITFLLFYIFKLVCSEIIKKKHEKKFINMMDAMDVIWAVENENSKSIINVISEVEPMSSTENSDELLYSVKQSVLRIKDVCPKMFYLKNCDYGYYFWEKSDHIDMNNYIRAIKMPDNLEINEKNFYQHLQIHYNNILPYNNRAMWEILISEKPLKDKNSFLLLLRFHHSLGDGVALLNLFLNTIGRMKTQKNEANVSQLSLLTKCKFNLHDIFNLRKLIKPIRKFLYAISKFISIICLMPVSLLNQALRPPDQNILHTNCELTGNKVISWVSDEYCSESLLSKMKRLRRRIPGVTFSELFLTALSISLQKYFIQKESVSEAPEIITVIVPARIDTLFENSSKVKTDEMLKLENKFSVAMLTVPVNINSSNKGNPMLQSLIAVRKETNKLRNSADFFINYLIMKIGGGIFPESILKPMLASTQATMVVSNLPGPSDVTVCDKYKLRKMAFFVPNRGTTGVGVTILSCNERINLGIIMDSALVHDNQDGDAILKNIIQELDAMDVFTSRCIESY